MTKQKHKFKYICFLLLFFLCSVKGMAANYYWVGGKGNWSDIGHWRTASGGSGIPSVVPGPTDDVFFDANSGFTASSKTVIVNVVANCRNITFSGMATPPALGGGELNIYGSSVWQTGMTVGVSAIYYRNANTPKTIKSNGVSFNGDVNLEEETSVSLSDDLSVSRYLSHTAGTWNTNNYKVTASLGYFGNSGTKPRTLNMGSSDFFIAANLYGFNSDSSLLTLNAGTSHIHLSGSNVRLQPYAGQIFYNVTFDNPLETGELGYFQTGKVYYNRVEFKGGGTFNSNNEIKELIFAEGKKYIFPASSTQTVTSSFKAVSSDCGEWINISSSTLGTQAKLVALPGVSIDVSRAVIKDIQASGGALFTAAHSTDSGNNSGWTFPSSSLQNLYWVGGSGDWNDKQHWSATSGGSGGSCLPGPRDNVFFDTNSGFNAAGKTVTLSSRSYTHDVTFSGSSMAPVLKGESMELNIYGSSEWQVGMEVKVGDIFYRNTNEAKTIKSNGVYLNSFVRFEEESSISLLDDFYTKILYHIAGTWNTNNYKVTLENSFGMGTGVKAKIINMGSSDFYIVGDAGQFSTNTSFLTLNCGTSHIHFLGLNPSFTPSAGQVYYDISFENADGNGRLGFLQSSKVYYNRVEFKGNGALFKDHQMKELVFAQGKKYTLSASSTQTITSSFIAHAPTCGEWISISSSATGTQAKIVAASGVSIDVSRAMVRDIQASGGALFTAVSSTDGGNNTGWTFPASSVNNLYWVGGSGNWNDRNHWSQISGGTGGYCIPGPTDNVFFDEHSGFTATSKTVTLAENASCRDINFSDNVASCILNGNNKELNIYGSSQWQNSVAINISKIYFRNTNEAKSIKTNGARMMDVYFDEKTSISLLDDFSISRSLTHNAGTWNTNNYKVTLYSGYIGNDGTIAKTINMGSSGFYINSGPFSADSALLTLNSGTSHIHFLSQSYIALNPYAGQTYYDVSYEGTAGSLGKTQTGKVYYNRVEFKGNGTFIKDNQIKELILTAGKTYTLDAGSTQTVTDQLYASGNSCFVLFLKSSVAGTKANLNIEGGSTNFDFANVRDINASGQLLNLGSKSSDAGNNSNMTFETYDPSAFSGFAGQDWSHAKFKNNDPDSYTLSTAGFYGNPYTTYKWTKINDPAHTGTIGTGPTLDLRTFGYGTYHVKVEYSAPGSSDYCTVEESIKVRSFVPSMMNPGLPIRNY